MSTGRPRIALAIGDPAGIGPELAAQIIADGDVRQDVDLIVVGDKRVLARGAEVAGVGLDLDCFDAGDELPADLSRPALVDLRNLDPVEVEIGVHSKKSGQSALHNFTVALGLGAAEVVGAVAFTPFNKAAMRLAHPTYDDEITFLREKFPRQRSAAEFNILPGLWNARVSSHVPISEVAGLVTRGRILEMLELTRLAMREAGVVEPRIAVAALNPHAGDGGNFGREEIDIIGPAVAVAQGKGIVCDGPFPADTVFWRTRNGEFDAVLTMYHDQGQIAMKLIGFDKGVTLLGGLDIPILTPAHGSAYDIAGKGVAATGATKAAIKIAAKMARARLKGPYRSGCTAAAAASFLA